MSRTQRRVRRENYEAMLNRTRRTGIAPENSDKAQNSQNASKTVKKEHSTASTSASAAFSTRSASDLSSGSKRNKSNVASFRIGDSQGHHEFLPKDVAGIQVRECDEKTDLEGLYDQYDYW